LVEIGRSAGTTFAPLGIVQRHLGGRTGRPEVIASGYASGVEDGRGAHTGKRDIGGKSLAESGTQFATADTRQCAQTDARDYTRLVALDARGKVRGVDLVHDLYLRHVLGPDFLEHRIDGRSLLVARRVRGVDDVQQEIGLGRRRERRAKRRHEIVREVADEADGVGQHDRCGPGDVYPAQRGVERGEELIGRVSL